MISVEERRGDGDRQRVLGGAVATAILGAALIFFAPEAAPVGIALAGVGVAAAWSARNGMVWFYWAALGLLAAAVGSRVGAGTFDPLAAAATVALVWAATGCALVAAAADQPGDDTLLQRAAALAGPLFGRQPARWRARGDSLVNEGAHRAGGWLAIEAGTIVVTHRASIAQRVLGPSAARLRLEPGEMPLRAFSLTPLTLGGVVDGTWARDAVPAGAFQWRIAARLANAGGSSSEMGLDDAARRFALAPGDLTAAVAAAADTALREAVRNTRMDELFDAAGDQPPGEVALLAARVPLAATLAGWGLALDSWQLVGVAPPPDVEAALVAAWRARETADGARGTVPERAPVPVAAGRSPLAESAPSPGPEPALPAPALVPEPAADRVAEQPRAAARADTAPVESGPGDRAAQSNTERAPSNPEREALARDLKEAAALARAARRGVAPAAGVRSNPVSFSQFLSTLQRRAADGDESADAVLRQVLTAMSRLERPAGEPRGDDDDSAALVPAEGAGGARQMRLDDEGR